MAAQHTDRYDDLTLQLALGAERNANVYLNDARYAFQRRTDEISFAEAKGMQSANASGVAVEAMQLRTAVQTPPIIIEAKQG